MNNSIKNTNIKDVAIDINTFLKFCYSFPYDLKDRMVKAYGESLGNHFWNEYEGNCIRRENNFVALIYTYGDMTTENQTTFIQLIDDYYHEVK